MPAINTCSSFTHLNEVYFHLSCQHLEYASNYCYQEISMVLLHSQVFTSPILNFPEWQSYEKSVDLAACTHWEPQPMHPEEPRWEPMSETPSTANCRPVCGRLGNAKELKTICFCSKVRVALPIP